MSAASALTQGLACRPPADPFSYDFHLETTVASPALMQKCWVPVT